tara:strand:+ start:162 stop:812 length:651 start_codon:yes stop_codon:yes gene_type:complete
MSNWKEILKNKEGPKTKEEIIDEHNKFGELSTKISDLYGRSSNPLSNKPRWSGALSSLNDLRSGYRVSRFSRPPTVITETNKIVFEILISASGKSRIGVYLDANIDTDDNRNAISALNLLKFMKDFVDIYNRPNHKYKNIEARLLYKTSKSIKDMGISVKDIILGITESDTAQNLLINGVPISISPHDYVEIRALKGIQIDPNTVPTTVRDLVGDL